MWQKRGIQLGLGVGIEAGYATLGRIGFQGRYDYGALGPVTNLASRLSTHASAGQILIWQRVFGAVDEAVDACPFGELDLPGFARPITAYEVKGMRSEGSRSGGRTSSRDPSRINRAIRSRFSADGVVHVGDLAPEPHRRSTGRRLRMGGGGLG